MSNNAIIKETMISHGGFVQAWCWFHRYTFYTYSNIKCTELTAIKHPGTCHHSGFYSQKTLENRTSPPKKLENVDPFGRESFFRGQQSATGSRAPWVPKVNFVCLAAENFGRALDEFHPRDASFYRLHHCQPSVLSHLQSSCWPILLSDLLKTAKQQTP